MSLFIWGNPGGGINLPNWAFSAASGCSLIGWTVNNQNAACVYMYTYAWARVDPQSPAATGFRRHWDEDVEGLYSQRITPMPMLGLQHQGTPTDAAAFNVVFHRTSIAR